MGMTDRSHAGALLRALSLPPRLLRAGLTEDENARVRVDPGAYVLELDLPGYEADAFDVSWGGGYLSVAATGADRSYEASFQFPPVVRPDDIRAAYDADTGVLTVTLPVHDRHARPAADPSTAD